jgi:arsenate reductase (thioredoxin)
MEKVKSTVLFLCSANSARSQMAEAFLRHYADEDFDVYSAGIEAKGINPYTIRTMDERGIDIRQHTSDSLGSIGGIRYYNYIITVCSEAEKNCPSGAWALGSKRLHWNFDDPAQAKGTETEILEKFRDVRGQIEERVQTWLKELDLRS